MKEYWKSDYSLNKRSSGIVYQFADGLVEITLEDYIRENPGKTAEDFLALKAISDEIYQQQFSRIKAQVRKELPLFDCLYGQFLEGTSHQAQAEAGTAQS